MRIVKRGVPPQEKYYSSTCPGCETQFEYKRSEVNINCIDPRDYTWTINCPLCKKMLYLQPQGD